MENLLTLQKNFLQQTNRPAQVPLVGAFLDPRNVAFIKDQIEQSLKYLTGQCVEVPITNELTQTLYDVLKGNWWMAYRVEEGLRLLNRMVVEHETKIQYYSLRHRCLYYKYFIHGDRMKVFPRAIPTHANGGEVTVSASGYTNSHPWAKRHREYLDEVLCVNQPEYEEWPVVAQSGCVGNVQYV